MNIFGFTISRRSKEEKEKRHLEVFHKCVIGINQHVNDFGEYLNHMDFSMNSFQDIMSYQETLDSLLEIYSDNIFSTPSGALTIAQLNDMCRKCCHDIGQCFRNKEEWEINLKKAKDIQDIMTYDEEDMINIFGDGFTAIKKRITYDMEQSIRSYQLTLKSILFNIRYDLMRLMCNVDIIDEYHKMKKHKKCLNTEFTLKFKKLSKKEINMQRRNEK